jgi:hypothetical protein
MALPDGTWNFSDVCIHVAADGNFGLYDRPFALPVPLPGIAGEISIGPGPIHPPAASAQCSSANVLPRAFVMLQRLDHFQMYDVLSHGVGTWELYTRAAAATPLHVFVLDASYKARASRELRVLSWSQLRAGFLLPRLAMGLDERRLLAAGMHAAPCRLRDGGGCNFTAAAGEVVGGGEAFSGIGGKERRREQARLHAFRRAIARTLRLDFGAPADRVLFVLRGGRSRVIANEGALLADESFPRRVAEATGLRLSFVRMERLSLEEQFAAVARARVLVGNHGAGLTWAALLPTDARPAAVVELWANESKDGLPVDIAHFCNAGGARHVSLPQQTTDRCRGKLVRTCGDIVVDRDLLLETIITTARALNWTESRGHRTE